MIVLALIAVLLLGFALGVGTSWYAYVTLANKL